MGDDPKRKPVMVVGVGNPERGDDGVGPLVVAGLGNLPLTRLRTCNGDVLSLLDAWSDVAAVVLIDAAQGLGTPGRIHRLDLAAMDLTYDASSSSTHGFGLAEAIGLARALHRLPGHVVIYTVEGACFERGAVMTPEVAAAVAELRACVRAEVARLNFEH